MNGGCFVNAKRKERKNTLELKEIEKERKWGERGKDR